MAVVSRTKTVCIPRNDPPGNLSEIFNVMRFGATGNGATADTAAIQKTITNAEASPNGTVFFPDGTYMVTDTLLINAGVHIKLSQGATVKQESGTNKAVLQTQAVDATPATITALTASANVATVTITAHGYSVGEHIFIYGVDTDGYNGVYEVKTTADADTLTVRLPYAPLVTTAVGTMRALPGIEKVVIEGGEWDYDSANNGSAADTDKHLIIAAGIHTLVVRNVKLLGALKYAIYPAGVQYLTMENVDFDTNSDGIHLLGPIYSADIRNIKGRTEDNMVAISTGDGTWDSVLPYQGSINVLNIDGIYPENTLGGVIRAFGENSGATITATAITKSATDPTVTTSAAHGLNPKDVIQLSTIVGMTELSGRVLVVGETPTATTFKIRDLDTSGYTTFTSGTLEMVSSYRVKNVAIKNGRYAQNDDGTNQAFLQGLPSGSGTDTVMIDNLTIENINADEAMDGSILELNTAAAGVIFVDNITFKSMHIDLPEGGAAGDFSVIRLIKGGGDTLGFLVNDINLVNCKIRGYRKQENNRCIYVLGAGQVKRFHLTDSIFDAVHSAIHFNSSGIADGYDIFVNGCTFINGLQGMSSNVAPMTIYAVNTKGFAMLYGLTRHNGTGITHTIYGDNINWSSDPVDTVGGTGYIRALGLGLRTKAVDLTPVSGDYVWDTDDSRPETYNGAAWVAM